MRFARHVALPEVGTEGQARIERSIVAVVGTDLGAETAARYLEAAGARVRMVGPPPADREAWRELLGAVSAAVVSGEIGTAAVAETADRAVPVVVVPAHARPEIAVAAGAMAAAEVLLALAAGSPRGSAVRRPRLPEDGAAR